MNIASKAYQEYLVFVDSKSLRGRSKAEYLRQVRKLGEHYASRSLQQLSGDVGDRQPGEAPHARGQRCQKALASEHGRGEPQLVEGIRSFSRALDCSQSAFAGLEGTLGTDNL
jgi:hypothetical protein